MGYFYLKKAGDNDVLHEGTFYSFKDCVEDAVSKRICLDFIDLRGANLMNAELDDGCLNYARFDNANLSGANLSAASLKSTCFKNSVLYNTCLCESKMSGAKFFGASFGATDIAWADISYTCFDTFSALDLHFSDVFQMKGVMFYDHTGVICHMSFPPIQIKGLNKQVVLFDDYMKVGGIVLPYASWVNFKETGILGGLDVDTCRFIKTYGAFLMTLAGIRSNSPESIKNHKEIMLKKNVA